MTILRGRSVLLRPVAGDDIATLAAIRATPEVYERWSGEDFAAELAQDLIENEIELLAIELDGVVVGMIQWHEETDAKYRHAGIDMYLDPAVHGRGLGSDAVRTLSRFIFDECGHHRIVIDPAADNTAAIRCYAKVGFKAVGVMRQYERGNDGTWHDGLLMDLLTDEIVED